MDTLLKIGIIGVLDIKNTVHPGKQTEEQTPLIDKLSCSLMGVSQRVCIGPSGLWKSERSWSIRLKRKV